MRQTKKIVINTIQKQQEDLLAKLYRELEEIESSLEDKKTQIEMQETILQKIKEN